MIGERRIAEQAIAHDLDACDLGLALTKGAVRRRYRRQRKACFDALREMNREDGLDRISDEQLLAELTS